MATDFQPKTPAQQVVEVRYGRPVGDVIRELYGAGRSQSEVASELGISRQTLALWMAREGIAVRTSTRGVA